MENNGARPKEKRDAMRSSGGYRERHNMDNTGARPQGTLDASSCSGGQNMDYQIPSRSVETSKFERHLSLCLCDVLDKVGASEEFRKLRQECALSKEIIMTLIHQLKPRQVSMFIFGSSSEGTTTPGMDSDIDFLACHDYLPVVDNISHTEDKTSLLLIIRDKHTKPGYVKLQRVYNGQPKTVNTWDIQRDVEESDDEGRICLKHLSALGTDKEFDERNGPADTCIGRNADHVNGLRCSKIPEFCTDWIVRKRSYRWPSKHVLVKMSTMGCFVVGVGHPASKEKNIEWRLSFSLQERELMFSMNLVQHKCYILLKLIKKDTIEPLIGKLISSYHLKTCMFYVIENTNPKLWKRRNLAQCVLLCLHVLFKWVLKGYCPNFFIKDENMFEREIHRTQKENAVQQLKHLLSNGCEILFLIKRDYIGDFLTRVKSSVEIEDVLLVFKSKFTIKIDTVIQIIKFKTKLCCKLNERKTPLQTLQYLHTIYLCYSQTNCMKDHTEQQTQESITFILPYVHLQMAQSYASAAFSIDVFEDKSRLLQSWEYHLNLGHHCDMTSSRLLEVTILYKLEQYEKCILILDQLEQEKKKSLSICRCDESPVAWFCIKSDFTQLNNLTVASIFSRTSSCVIYLRSDVAIIPQALQLEMYRSFGTTHGSRSEIYDDWMDLVVVDANVYLHFIKYLACTNRSQLIQKHMARNNLESVLKSKTPLYHRETGYNLLGWICFLEGWIRQGIQYFRKSWSLRPHHNAAKFHIMFYIFGDRRYKL